MRELSLPNSDVKTMPPPFVFAFFVAAGASTHAPGGKMNCSCFVESVPENLLTAWRHLSSYVLAFELPEEAEVTARTATVIAPPAVIVARWDTLSHDRYEGVLYVRKGLSGQVYRFDQAYSRIEKSESDAALKRIFHVVMEWQKARSGTDLGEAKGEEIVSVTALHEGREARL